MAEKKTNKTKKKSDAPLIPDTPLGSIQAFYLSIMNDTGVKLEDRMIAAEKLTEMEEYE